MNIFQNSLKMPNLKSVHQQLAPIIMRHTRLADQRDGGDQCFNCGGIVATSRITHSPVDCRRGDRLVAVHDFLEFRLGHERPVVREAAVGASCTLG